MAEIEKVDMKSKNIKSEQVERLKTIFPEIMADGKINFEQLKATLGEEIEDSKERFGMTWAGKSKCFRIIQDPSTGTLKPSREESVNFDTTENLFIEGDNLEVLKLLQKSYYEKIKMIYIDPPYNTGNDFVYNDKFGQQLDEYLKITGQTDESGKKLSTNTDSSGRFHSSWMNMMYPRIFLARNLLKEDGVIFISIDDSEYDNLKKICEEIFGEENYIGTFVWRKKVGAGADSKYFFRQHEEILLFAKNINNIEGLYQPLNDDQKKEYSNPDNDSRGDWAPTDLGAPAHDKDPRRIYEVVSPKGAKHKKCWAYTKENFEKLVQDNLVYWGRDGTSMPKRKRFLNDKQGLTPRSWIDFCLTSDGKKDLLNLDFKLFDYPKPVQLVKHFLTIGADKDSIILDFFAGSGTTAQAVLDLNKEDQGNRRFICIQLPEPTNEKSEGFKEGYKNISDISKERIRRVIKQGSTESQQQKLSNDKKLDLGFRVFKLDRSNFKKWDNQTSELQTSLSEHVEQIKSNANPEDVLYEILIKDGFELTTKINKVQVKGKDVYSIENNLLLICLDDKLDLDLFKEMKKLNPHLVIVLDKGFKDNDQLKTNAVQTLGKNSDEEYILRSI